MDKRNNLKKIILLGTLVIIVLAVILEFKFGTSKNIDTQTDQTTESKPDDDEKNVSSVDESEHSSEQKQDPITIQTNQSKEDMNEQLKQADDYLKSTNPDDHKKAFEIYKQCAEKGNHKAELMLGEMYQEGKGVQQSNVNALNYLEKAFYDKDTKDEAEYHVCSIYIAEKKYDKAVPLLKELTEKDYQNSAVDLASLYFTGAGDVPRDQAKARAILEKASRSGNVNAEVFLGDLYFRSYDVPEATKLWEVAAKKNNNIAQFKLGYLYIQGMGMFKLFLDKKKGLMYLNQSANNGNIRAMLTLGDIYYNGKYEVKPNKEKAIGYFERAKAAGDSRAAQILENIAALNKRQAKPQ
ncbi:tetratricopeptide repeat protein [Pseudofrancisella aestuarii]|uniref:Tetratricopeptide repeat protein n=1 Tax=Pseudofrancisella aestuarii TaxID=2670347 RepID=A0ABV9TD18_9GAMM|nr:tetratricopeptide repeat protein [Pseudofrancisella aestuarii]